MKKFFISASILALSLFLNGCGSNKKDEIADELRTIQNESANETSSNTLFAPQSVDDLSFNVKIDSSGSNSAKIYSANAIEFTDETLKNYAEKAFDANSWEICKPYGICSKDELIASIEEIDNINKNADKDKCFPMDYTNNLNYMLNNYNENNVCELVASNCIAEYDTKFGPVKGALFKGKIDGADFAMIYTDLELTPGTIEAYEKSSQFKNPANLRFQRLTPSYIYNGSHNKKYSSMQDTYKPNEVAKASSQKIAEEFLDKLGFSNFIVMDIGSRACILNDTEYCYDGYSFTFVRQIDGVTCPLMAYNEIIDVTKSREADKTIVNGYEEFIRVDVDSNGVVLAEFYHPYEIGETTIECPNIMSSDQAIKLANEAINNSFLGKSDPLKIEVRFTYIPFVYEDKSAFVPAWVIVEPADEINASQFGEESILADNPLFVINALDGSEIIYSGLMVYTNMYQGEFSQ